MTPNIRYHKNRGVTTCFTHDGTSLVCVYLFMPVCADVGERACRLLAAIIHDTAHDGLNNNYHKNAVRPLVPRARAAVVWSDLGRRRS